MTIYKDANLRGSKLAKLLFTSFSKGGIHGKNDMPEDILPERCDHRFIGAYILYDSYSFY